MRTGTAACMIVLAVFALMLCSADGSDAGAYRLEDGVLTVETDDYVLPFPEDVRSDTVSLVLSEGVTSVRADSFSGFAGLRTAEFSVTVSQIGDRAFMDTGLTGLTIPDTLSRIGADAFSRCTYLESAELGSGLTDIGRDAFSDCTSLMTLEYGCPLVKSSSEPRFTGSGAPGMTVAFGASVSSVPANMFSGCDVCGVTFAAGPMHVGAHAFSGCSSLASADFSRISSAGDGAFSGTGLTSVRVPADTGSGAFSGCMSLTEADLTLLTSVPDGLFYGCAALHDVRFSDDTVRIGARAFADTAVTDVLFSPELDSVGDMAFAGCPIGTAVFLGDLDYAGSQCIPSGADIVLQSVRKHGSGPFGEPASVMMPGEPDGLFPPGTMMLGTGDAVTYVTGDTVTVLPFGTEYPGSMVPGEDVFLGWFADGVPAEPAKGAVLTAKWADGLKEPEEPEDRSMQFAVGAMLSAAALAMALLAYRKLKEE